MDNITHTLAGVMVAEGLHHYRLRRGHQLPAAWAPVAMATSVFTGNAPDLDLIYSGNQLAYLMHHRGITHTLIAVPVLALAGLVFPLLWIRFRRLDFSRQDHLWLGLLALAGGLLHILLDFGNVYGVHPFWPFDASWIYGDRIFIVEPWLWFSMLPCTLFLCRHRPVLRLLTGTLILLTTALLLTVDLVSAVAAGLVISWGLILFALGSVTGPAQRLVTALVAVVMVSTCFILTGNRVEAMARHHLAGGGNLHDLSLSPLPGNPFCWFVVSAETRGDQYIARRAVVAPWPQVLQATGCPPAPKGFAPLAKATTTGADAYLLPVGVFRGTRARFDRLLQDSCVARGAARFYRNPFWDEKAGITGDLRFDNRRRAFANLRLNDTHLCPDAPVPWTPPRQDIFPGLRPGR